ncbi:helix-turn-helix transcriptional regulator [Paenibacillus cymbidii]|uniref:helix-turn-helix transcriptional regulator n=1 Tax=Paenibacillus cymbidii TaxID=1639034 RepID=UPI00108200A2|nr:AraC family transcriptional regulator [Paenibacillus cymbidii]
MPGNALLVDYDFDIEAISHMTEREPNPNWKITAISYANVYMLVYCREGEAVYHVHGGQRHNGGEPPLAHDDRQHVGSVQPAESGDQHHVRKGDLLFLPKGLVRSAYSDPDNPWSFCTVSFTVRFHNEQTRQLFDRFKPVIRSPHLYRMPALFAELLHVWTGQRSGYTIKCKSIVMDILHTLIQDQDHAKFGVAHYNAIERTTQLILTNYKDHFSIDELASHAGLSSSHFRLLFKRIIGMTAVQYQNRIRINKAKGLLMSGEYNVTEAALAVGFQDIYYFSRLFKKLTRESPSHYANG